MYQEFADDIELRRQRLARQQFWFRVRRELRRPDVILATVFLLLLVAGVAIVMLA